MLNPTITHHHRLPLALGDVVTFLAFAALGRRAHSMGNALDDLTATALPFVLSWFLVAPFTGAFGAEATTGVGSAARRAALTWLLAFPLGLLFRTAIVGRLPHYSFAIVAGIFTFIMLTGWRSALAKALS